jgi:hypothetical protein
MMKRLLTCAIAVSLAATAAEAATDWYILEPQAAVCTQAAKLASQYGMQQFKSPGALETFLRRIDQFKQTYVVRDDQAVVTAAAVVEQSGLAVTYFANRDYCMRARDAAIISGVLNDPEELK